MRSFVPVALVAAACAPGLCVARPAPLVCWNDVENPSCLTNAFVLPPSFTAMTWFEADAFAEFAPLLTYSSDFASWTDGFGLFTLENGSVAAFVRSLDDAVLMAPAPGTNAPCHVALSYSGAEATLYVNGLPAASTNFASSASLDCGAPLWAGTPKGTTASPSFEGLIWGARIFPSALGWREVASAYVADRIARRAASGAGALPLDSDGDGMPDEWELKHGFNPCDPSDAVRDPDGDGISNLDEFRRGLNPRVKARKSPAALLKSCTVYGP